MRCWNFFVVCSRCATWFRSVVHFQTHPSMFWIDFISLSWNGRSSMPLLATITNLCTGESTLLLTIQDTQHGWCSICKSRQMMSISMFLIVSCIHVDVVIHLFKNVGWSLVADGAAFANHPCSWLCHASHVDVMIHLYINVGWRFAGYSFLQQWTCCWFVFFWNNQHGFDIAKACQDVFSHPWYWIVEWVKSCSGSLHRCKICVLETLPVMPACKQYAKTFAL